MKTTIQIAQLQELIACNEPLYYWHYDAEKQLIESDCPAQIQLDRVFRHNGGLDAAYASADRMPLILTNESNLVWLAAYEYEEESLKGVHLLGPLFSGDIAEDTMARLLHRVAGVNVSKEWRQKLSGVLRTLPSVSSLLYSQYLLMLHYCISGERVKITDIRYYPDKEISKSDFPVLKEQKIPHDRILIYRAEKALLNMVREGDLEAMEEAKSRAASLAQVRSYVKDPLKNAQIACTIFTSLCTRAAIEGGLSPTISYALGDAYIKSMFHTSALSEVRGIKNQMYEDYIRRVHEIKVNPKYSKPIQSTCDYLHLQLANPLDMEMLAERLGYSKYYLSRLFKKETGISVNDYLRKIRIERACLMLGTTGYSIDEIAVRTGFGSRSFFANTFKKYMGMTPVQYRQEALRE